MKKFESLFWTLLVVAAIMTVIAVKLAYGV